MDTAHTKIHIWNMPRLLKKDAQVADPIAEVVADHVGEFRPWFITQLICQELYVGYLVKNVHQNRKSLQ